MLENENAFEERTMPAAPTIEITQPSSSQEHTNSVPSDDRKAVGYTSKNDEAQNTFLPPTLATLHEERSISPSSHSDDDSAISWNITYSSRLVFKGSQARRLPDSQAIRIHDEGIYEKIEAELQEYIKVNYAEDLESQELLFRYANCTIIGDKGYRLRLPLLSKDDWSRIRKKMIKQWSTDEKFRLEILHEYCVRKHHSNAGDLEADLKEDLQRLMKWNWARQPYIPHKDLEKVMPTSTIREIINHNLGIDTDPTDKEQLIEVVQTKARVLFAALLHAGLAISCLKELIDRGLSDKDFPLKEKDRCHNGCKLKFKNQFLVFQSVFMAARFDYPGGHQTLDHRVVLPIHFCPTHTILSNRPVDEADYEPGKSIIDEDKDDSNGKRDARCGRGAYGNVYCVKVDPHHHRLLEVRYKSVQV